MLHEKLARRQALAEQRAIENQEVKSFEVTDVKRFCFLSILILSDDSNIDMMLEIVMVIVIMLVKMTIYADAGGIDEDCDVGYNADGRGSNVASDYNGVGYSSCSVLLKWQLHCK